MSKNKKKSKSEVIMDGAKASQQQLTSTPTARGKEGAPLSTSNPFDSLYLDAEGESSFLGRSLPPLPGEHPLPSLPVIQNVDKLNESQRTFLMLQFAEQMGLKPGDCGIDPPETTTTTSDALAHATALPMGAKPRGPAAVAAAAKAAAKTAAAKTAAPKTATAKTAAAKTTASTAIMAAAPAAVRAAAPAAIGAAAPAANGAAAPALTGVAAPEVDGAAASAAVGAAADVPPGLPGQRSSLPGGRSQRNILIPDRRDRSASLHRKRKMGGVTDVTESDEKRQRQMSTSGDRVQRVFLTGVDSNLTKNDILFHREMTKVVPNIKIERVIFTRSGSIIVFPATPSDFSRIMKEDWAKHASLGENVAASLPRNQTVEFKAVVTKVSPEIDDDTLKTEIEERNNLKVTKVTRLFNKEKQTKIFKAIICLENEEAQQRVLKEGVYLGFTHHQCVKAFEKHQDNSGSAISQCFKCQKWNPDHNTAQCKGQRACLWCGADHFHKECPHFQSKNRESAKCANCKEAHPSWSKNCEAFVTASKSPPKVTASRIVSSSSMSRSEFEAEMQQAMGDLWSSLAVVVSTAVSKAVLDLEADLKKGKVNHGDLVLRTAANTVKAIKACGLLHPSRTIEVAGVQQKVWKDVFPRDEFPTSSQASSSQNNAVGAS